MTAKNGLQTQVASLESNDQLSICMINKSSEIQFINEKFLNKTEYTSKSLIGKKSHTIHLANEFGVPIFEAIRSQKTRKETYREIITYQTSAGEQRFMDTNIHVAYDAQNEIEYLLLCEIPIACADTDAEKYVGLLKSLHNIVFKYTVNEQNQISFKLLEGKIARNLGLVKNNLTFKKMRAYFELEELKEIHYFLRRGLSGEAIQCELRFKEHFFLIYLTPVFANGKVVEVVGTGTDITDRVKAEQKVQKMAYYDYLTGLPNRRFLKRKAEAIITNDVSKTDSFAIMFLDLNRFKKINDSLGHVVGDEVLAKVSQKLREVLDDSILVSRYGGDEFLLVVPNATPLKAQQIATEINEQVNRVTLCSTNSTITVSTSIGISLYPQDGEDFETLIRNANAAMYVAKKCKTRGFQLFNDYIREEKTAQSSFTSKLRDLFNQGQLQLSYAPRIQATSGTFLGVQMSVTVEGHPIEDFVIEELSTMTKDLALINEIGQWALEQACVQGVVWEKQRQQPVQINIGVTKAQFEHPLFMACLTDILERTKLTPSSLNLEFSNEVLEGEISDSDFRELRSLGVKVSLVNFGVSPISLQEISLLPINYLKLSASLTSEETSYNEAIIKSILLFAEGIGIKTVVESDYALNDPRFTNFGYDEMIAPSAIFGVYQLS